MSRFSSYSFGEARTGLGQLVHFSGSNKGKNFRIIKAVLHRLVRHIDVYATREVTNLTHGSYGRYTRYDVTQHEYAGSRGGYIEVLEIKNPPDDRCPFVIFEYRPEGGGERGSYFSEWETLALARRAWKKYIKDPYKTKLAELKGCKRVVQCDLLTPWFYAVGDQALVGDYAFPNGLQDDLVFSIGKRFVVTDWEGKMSIKTCLGCRFLHYKEKGSSWDRYQDKQVVKRVVYWNDGTTWADNPGTIPANKEPRPLRDDELWVSEALAQFQTFLSGGVTDFSISLIGGQKFVGKLVTDKSKAHQVEGRYLTSVVISGRAEPLSGTVDFSPTPELPDVVTFIHNKLKLKSGQTIERVEIKDIKPPELLPKNYKARRWSGVFFRKP